MGMALGDQHESVRKGLGANVLGAGNAALPELLQDPAFASLLGHGWICHSFLVTWGQAEVGSASFWLVLLCSRTVLLRNKKAC